MQQIKGAVLKSRMAFVQEHFGVDGVQRVMASLPEGDQRILRMLFTSNWYPFEIGQTLDDAIVRVLGGGKTEFFERLGAASAEKNLATIHSGYLTKGDATLSPSHSLYYDRSAGSIRRDRRRASSPPVATPSALPIASR